MKRYVPVLVPLALALPSAAPAMQGPAKSVDKDQVVCKRESVIGSRVQKRRICLTRAEWAKLEIGTRDGMADYLQKSTSGAGRQ